MIFKRIKKKKTGLSAEHILIIITFTYFRGYKKFNLVRFNIKDYFGEKPNTNEYSYQTQYHRNHDEFFDEFLSKVIQAIGEYVCFKDHRRVFFIEYRHVLVFTSEGKKRSNLDLIQLSRAFLRYSPFYGSKGKYKLQYSNTCLNLFGKNALIVSGYPLTDAVINEEERIIQTLNKT